MGIMSKNTSGNIMNSIESPGSGISTYDVPTANEGNHKACSNTFTGSQVLFRGSQANSLGENYNCQTQIKRMLKKKLKIFFRI